MYVREKNVSYTYRMFKH